jgi:DNA helicase-4
MPDLESRNRWFLNEETKQYREFFDTVEKNPLTDEQREAVVTFDDNVMTVAAAGSGKTSVLVAKAGYAVAAGLFKPEEILLLAFNRKAAEELQERVAERLGSRIERAERVRVTTFHSLGLDVITMATGERPKIAPWIENSTELAELVDIVRTLSAEGQFASKWNLFQAVYARSLPAFGAEEEPEAWDPETGVLGFRTLRGETVRSQEERMICDWLAQVGIAYEYERPYEYDTATSTHRQYMPDFFYPSANVYHEHFALDENGRPPSHFTGYADGVEWKRTLHEERGTTLIETTSHGIRSAGGFEQFRVDLESVDVQFSEVALQDDPLARVSEEASLLRVFRTFLSHVKSNQLTMAELRARSASRHSQHPERDRLFLDIFEELWKEWDKRLENIGAVDFEDMLVLSSEYLAAGRCAMPYRLVMADEFQDSSRIRGTMLRELTSDIDSRLYVVGDDWQAINRFAGADISLMREFEKHIGPYSLTQLTWTFRCPADICEIAGNFVVQNPYQLKKNVRAMNKRPAPNVFCFQLSEFEKQESLLRSHLLQLARKTHDSKDDKRVSAYVLGRYHSDKPATLSDIAAEVSDTVDLHWSTIHAAKGLEADYVFLVNVIEGTKGLPSKIEDDSTLWLAMPDGETFSYAEERRLFYVALTRAKRMVFIYTDAYRRSEFIAELENQGTGTQIRGEGTGGKEKRRCPRCSSGLLMTRSGKFGEFLSCSRFPRCDYTETIRRQCPECGDGTMVAREGKYGTFLSCSRYPRCDYSEKPKKSRRPN